MIAGWHIIIKIAKVIIIFNNNQDPNMNREGSTPTIMNQGDKDFFTL